MGQHAGYRGCRRRRLHRDNNWVRGQSPAHKEAGKRWCSESNSVCTRGISANDSKPMPKHYPVFGHMIVLKETFQSLPRNTVMHVVVRRIAESFPGGVFYLNLWPFNVPIMVVANPYVASQVEAAFLDKPANISATLEIINGGPSLLTMNGATWKKWRAIFNPGFATGYITGLAPAIVDEVAVFCKLLQDRAEKGEVFPLEEHTLRLTLDIISRVTL